LQTRFVKFEKAKTLLKKKEKEKEKKPVLVFHSSEVFGERGLTYYRNICSNVAR
jgi:hypothetical protein